MTIATSSYQKLRNVSDHLETLTSLTQVSRHLSMELLSALLGRLLSPSCGQSLTEGRKHVPGGTSPSRVS